MKSVVIFSTLIIFLSGCSFSGVKSQEDYAGEDYSRIRVKNYLPPLTMGVYKKEGDCYKLVEKRNLGAGVNFIGIKSIYNKKIPGMLPASKELVGMDALEYKIKAGQRVDIRHTAFSNAQHIKYNTTYSYRFIPLVGHDYDIWVGDYDSIRVVDLTNANNAPENSWGTDKECVIKSTTWDGDPVYK